MFPLSPLTKLGLTHRAELVRLALDTGMLKPAPTPPS
jgi:hypothetical protein